MEAVYRLKPHELNDSFFKTIRELFGDKEVKITIETSSDATSFINQYPETRKLVLAGIEAVKQGRVSRPYTIEELEAMAE